MNPRRTAIQCVKKLGLFNAVAWRYLLWLAYRRKTRIVATQRNGRHVIAIIKDDRTVMIAPDKLVYAQDCINYFDYYYHAVLPEIDEQGLAVVDYSVPQWHTLSKSGSRYYFSLFAETEDTTQLYLDFLKPHAGSVVLDFGAYCGASTVALADACGESGRVIAVEPDPNNLAALEKNLAKYQRSNVTVIPKAIWPTETVLLFHADGGMGSSVATLVSRELNPIEVPTTSLQAIVETYGLTRIDGIKIDIEGAETEVLEKADTVLKRFNPKLIVEPHHVNGVSNFDRLQKLLTQHGYGIEVSYQAGSELPLILAAPKCST